MDQTYNFSGGPDNGHGFLYGYPFCSQVKIHGKLEASDLENGHSWVGETRVKSYIKIHQQVGL